MPQPEITFRHGSCSASIFENEYANKDGAFTVRTVSFQRSYRDKQGNWQKSTNLRVNDIPKAILVLNKAYEYLTSGVGADDTEAENAAEE